MSPKAPSEQRVVELLETFVKSMQRYRQAHTRAVQSTRGRPLSPAALLPLFEEAHRKAARAEQHLARLQAYLEAGKPRLGRWEASVREAACLLAQLKRLLVVRLIVCQFDISSV